MPLCLAGCSSLCGDRSAPPTLLTLLLSWIVGTRGDLILLWYGGSQAPSSARFTPAGREDSCFLATLGRGNRLSRVPLPLPVGTGHNNLCSPWLQQHSHCLRAFWFGKLHGARPLAGENGLYVESGIVCVPWCSWLLTSSIQRPGTPEEPSQGSTG